MTTTIIITLSVLLLTSSFLLGRVCLLSSSRHYKVSTLKAKIDRYRRADMDFAPLYVVRRTTPDSPGYPYNDVWAVFRVSTQDGYIHNTLIKAFLDEDDDFNKREADELCEKLNEK